jgi:GTP cyclohydrolase I
LIDKNKVEKLTYELLAALGENPEREGLVGTPKRIAKMWEELCAGMGSDPRQHVKLFTDGCFANEVVTVEKIPFSSTCEHHLMPFFGTATVSYIPKEGKIIGISKISSIINCFARRLQIQERLTFEIADFLYLALQPEIIAVLMDAKHTCMTVRGVRATGSSTVTSAFRGNPELREKLLR